MEPSDNKNEQTNTESTPQVNPNKKPPVVVVYCPKCGLPPEYCEFDDKCKTSSSAQSNLKTQNEEQKATETKVDKKPKEEKKTEDPEGEPKEKEESKESKPKKKVALKEENKIVISKQTRSKKKFLTSVTGLEKFNVNIKDFAKKMGKKFACGSSAISDDTIEIQGDIIEELKEFILKEFPHLNEKQIVIKEKK